MNYNQVTLIGRITADCDHKVLEKTGTHLVKFRIAVNDRINDKTLYINCTSFGKVAENLHAKLLKGTEVLVHGRLEMDTVSGDDGKKRDFYGVIVDKLEINYPDLDTKKS
jgi:single stranded DNA-binding protein